MAKYDEQAKDISYYVVTSSSEDACYVISKRSFPRLLRRVTFSKNECTCGYMDQFGIPCRHFIAALAEYEREDDTLTQYFHDYYTVAKYSEAFEGAQIRLPLEHELKRDKSCLPPLVVKRTGRRKQKRIRSNGE
ncbi:hypothetical protein P43SY_007630 [Pythium insidiosum]|uniref:SWIM-type domain-containing protein n=1 Tax=Pythium insidiosum TaxID=114742 RepID=A0AAD5LE31_PYTIN|nr:hypothetical protein P43SY_007630 [Pythium insidiosum]